MSEELDNEVNNLENAGGGVNFETSVELSESRPLKPAETPQITHLIEVRFEPEYKIQKGDRQGQVTSRLGYTFQSELEPERKTTFIDWEANSGDKEKDQKAWEKSKTRFAEIYRALTGAAPAKDFFAGIKSFKDAFALIAKTLNEGRDGKPLYLSAAGKPIKLWLIPVYFGNNVDLPLRNFVEAVKIDGQNVVKRPLIEVLPSHKIKREANTRNNAGGGIPGVDNAGGDFNITDLPGF